MKLPLMVGLGPVVDKHWHTRLFSPTEAWTYMNRTMPHDLKQFGFNAVVAHCSDHLRGSYAAMKEERKP